MEYFVLEQDTRICNTIHIQTMNYMSIRDAQLLKLSVLEPLTVVIRQGSRYEAYPDLLSRQLFMVSKTMKEVVDLFIPTTPSKIFCFWDQQKNQDFYYYAYSLPIIDCLSDRFVKPTEKVILKREAIGEIELFKAAGTDRHIFLASLPLAEALLRKRLRGIRLLETAFE